jgi:hypothetical protein
VRANREPRLKATKPATESTQQPRLPDIFFRLVSARRHPNSTCASASSIDRSMRRISPFQPAFAFKRKKTPQLHLCQRKCNVRHTRALLSLSPTGVRDLAVRADRTTSISRSAILLLAISRVVDLRKSPASRSHLLRGSRRRGSRARARQSLAFSQWKKSGLISRWSANNLGKAWRSRIPTRQTARPATPWTASKGEPHTTV